MNSRCAWKTQARSKLRRCAHDFCTGRHQNCGKTTLFNQLTGSNQHAWKLSGVTVDQKSGTIRGHKDMTVVDLPGIYSIRPYSAEEIVTRDFLLSGHPDGIINIIDATNIERNLYLTLQLIELGLPMVLALNMMDEVRANGGSVDVRALSEELGIPASCPSAQRKTTALKSSCVRPSAPYGSTSCPSAWTFAAARCTAVSTPSRT